MTEAEKQRLAEIRQRLEGATEGPWEIPEGDLNGRIWCIGPIAGYDFDALELSHGSANADFVSHAWEDIAFLLEIIGRARNS